MRMMWRLVWSEKGRGSRSRRMSVSSWRSCEPLRRLQSRQQATRFSQVERPPRQRGRTWSRVSSLATRIFWQYWQVLRSRRRMFLRERARVGVQHAALLFFRPGYALKNQHQRAAGAADVDGLVAGVEDQDGGLHGGLAEDAHADVDGLGARGAGYGVGGVVPVACSLRPLASLHECLRLVMVFCYTLQTCCC
jgi:hypothetical protein